MPSSDVVGCMLLVMLISCKIWHIYRQIYNTSLAIIRPLFIWDSTIPSSLLRAISRARTRLGESVA